MIISHKHNFIFIKTRKTAGTSLEFCLRNICGKDDIITRTDKQGEKQRSKNNLKGPQNNQELVEGNLIDIHQHVPASKVKSFVCEKTWDSYYKFCFERHPCEKIISHFYWVELRHNTKFNSISDYLDSEYFERIQEYYMYTIAGKLIVDDIFKYEALEPALSEISKKFNLGKNLKLPLLKAKSGVRKDFRHYLDIFSKKELQLIETKFSKEIKLLDYKI